MQLSPILLDPTLSTCAHEWVVPETPLLSLGKPVKYAEVEPQFRVIRPWVSKKCPRVILRRVADWISKGFSKVEPLSRDHSLFRNFASMQPTQEKILNFANQYGLMWDTEHGIPLSEWELEIGTMRQLIEINTALADRKSMARLIKQYSAYEGKYFAAIQTQALNYTRYGATEPSSSWGILGPQKGIDAYDLQEFLARAIDRRLRELGAVIGFDLVGRTKRDKHLCVTVKPPSLLAALWLQFANSVAAGTLHRPCEMCGKFLEISPQQTRADRRYCSNACRSKAKRRRQSQAIEMHSAGKTDKQIAAALDSTLETVRGWLKPKEK